MATLEPQPKSQPQPHEFYVRVEEVEDFLYRPVGRTTLEHHVSMDHLYLGLLHLEHSGDGNIAYIDGIDGADGEDAPLEDQQWEELVLHLYEHGLTKARRIEHPGGQVLLLDAVPEPQV